MTLHGYHYGFIVVFVMGVIIGVILPHLKHGDGLSQSFEDWKKKHE